MGRTASFSLNRTAVPSRGTTPWVRCFSSHGSDRVIARPRPLVAALTAGLTIALTLTATGPARGQVGQAPLPPANGLVGQAVQGLTNLDLNGPGWLYYGINAADRGLGYRGSYMTLGGFIPMVEDDLGGLWSADLRSHLSVYGGFFSNVGAVRKQFLGGTLLGVGVYWDYDGDLNQYPDTTLVSNGIPYSFAGGQVYNQVGVSGEWLTDLGNIRSNGYIPLGQTAQLAGPFLGNGFLCQNGINAALGGADLEVGAWIPGLTDWAGMISVGGYAFGNARYTFPDGAAAVPWFGGVYTRLDMTFRRNWDFSLQANNDSFFDWTGFARLTYRMGGSRRRNVPDQMEQPMFRNEHIVRAHQAPALAINPETGTPWRVFHVNNAAGLAGLAGLGTAAAPFTTLLEAETAATQPYDVVYVNVGNSVVNPYVTPVNGYSFAAPNQYLVGQGSAFALPTVNCGLKPLVAGGQPGLYPVITNPLGPAIAIDQPGTRVEHLQIVGSPVGISDGSGLAAPGTATIADVVISGGVGGGQRGVEIANSTGRFNFDRMRLENLDADGFVVSAAGGNVAISNSTLVDVRPNGLLVSGAGATVNVRDTSFQGTIDDSRAGTAVTVTGDGASVAIANSTITNANGDGLVAAGTNSSIDGTDLRITDTRGSALVASGPDATIRGERLQVLRTGSDAIVVSGEGADVILTSSTVSRASGFGAFVTGANSGLYLTGSTTITNSAADGIHVLGDRATVLVEDSSILNSGVNGIYVNGRIAPFSASGATQVSLLRSRIDRADGFGIFAEGVNAVDTTVPPDPAIGGVIQVFASTIQNTLSGGIFANASNFDIGRDPDDPSSTGSRIANTGSFGIAVNGASRVRVRNSTITGVDTGIEVTGGFGGVDNAANLIATTNTISTFGIGIDIEANHGPDDPPSFVNANIAQNRIFQGSESPGIRLVTTNPPGDDEPILRQPIGIENTANAFQLGAFNLGTSVEQDPDNRPALVAYRFRFAPAPAPVVALPPPTPAVPAPPP
jgi:hypothetical protein